MVAVDGIPAQGISCYTDADINFEWSGSVINIECKRPQTQNALTERVKEACQQLARPSRQGLAEVIAVDCSAFIRPLERLLEVDSAEDAERSLADSLVRDIKPKVEMYFETTILGGLLFARAPTTRRGHSRSSRPWAIPWPTVSVQIASPRCWRLITQALQILVCFDLCTNFCTNPCTHVVMYKGLRHYDAILVIHRYVVAGVSGGRGSGDVAHLHGRRQKGGQKNPHNTIWGCRRYRRHVMLGMMPVTPATPT